MPAIKYFYPDSKFPSEYVYDFNLHILFCCGGKTLDRRD